MSLSDWNWRLPADLQDVPWDCAACSTAWALRTIGLDYSEADVVNGLGPTRISPTYGSRSQNARACTAIGIPFLRVVLNQVAAASVGRSYP